MLYIGDMVKANEVHNLKHYVNNSYFRVNGYSKKLFYLNITQLRYYKKYE